MGCIQQECMTRPCWTLSVLNSSAPSHQVRCDLWWLTIGLYHYQINRAQFYGIVHVPTKYKTNRYMYSLGYHPERNVTDWWLGSISIFSISCYQQQIKEKLQILTITIYIYLTSKRTCRPIIYENMNSGEIRHSMHGTPFIMRYSIKMKFITKNSI